MMSRDSNPNLLLGTALADWNDLEREYNELEEDHKKYLDVLAKLSSAQKKCISQIKHHRYRIKCISESLAKASAKGTLGDDDKQKILETKKRIIDRKLNFREMEESLPHENGLYLKIILGSVNVSLLTKETKFNYKKNYETFKLTVSYIILALAFLVLVFFKSRWCDAALNFLCVWYYCTLTIRESILTVNGSRIKGWWVTHHFISTVCSGISLIWPDGYAYSQFRRQHILFTIYISFVYVLQYYYQSGCLYRLRSLGQGHDMDITVEGFMSWMWKGLRFLLPFLFAGYIFQLYNTYVLIQLAYDPQCSEWQVPCLAAIYLVLSVGNIWTTGAVMVNKLTLDVFGEEAYWKKKYRFVVSNLLSQGHSHAE